MCSGFLKTTGSDFYSWGLYISFWHATNHLKAINQKYNAWGRFKMHELFCICFNVPACIWKVMKQKRVAKNDSVLLCMKFQIHYLYCMTLHNSYPKQLYKWSVMLTVNGFCNWITQYLAVIWSVFYCRTVI